MAHYSNPNQIVWEKILKYNENNRKMLKDVQQKKEPETMERRVVKGGKPRHDLQRADSAGLGRG